MITRDPRRARRRAAKPVRPAAIAQLPAAPDAVAVIGVLPPDPRSITAAADAACRMVPPPAELVLAGTAAAVAAAWPMAEGLPPVGARVRLVTVADDAPAGEALAQAAHETTSAWVAFLDGAAELRPTGIAELVAILREHDLQAAFGELLISRPDGTTDRIGGWPVSDATFHGATLVVAGDVARGPVRLAGGDGDDPRLAWLLALMDAGCRTASAGITVARALPPDARSTRIRSIGAGVPYADGGEDRLLGIVGAAADRGSTSDELAASITDWTSRYHLSRLRGNIVASVGFPDGARVLDVGAGTGTIARALGERGLAVTALEGSFDRARVAAVRCAGLPGVEIVHGTIADYDAAGGFDAVVVIGVLEYSGAFLGGAAGPAAFLARVGGLLAPDGVLVLAIENRFGLKYLQGYAEDHLGRPWVGVDGYPTTHGVQTWSRRVLGGMLADAGLGAQRWRYPFPDYKLPTLVLDESAYRRPDAPTLVDALVRAPVRDWAHPRAGMRDDRGAHLGFLEAGLGEDVANSFLVIAGRDPGAVERFAPADGPVAWLYGDERAARWLRRRTVTARDGELVVDGSDASSTVALGGLVQSRPARSPFVAGRTLEQELKVALADDGEAGTQRVLDDWLAAIDAEAADRPAQAPGGAPAAPTPFSPGAPGRALPGDMLDLLPANFIRSADGRLVRIDREWTLAGGVDRDLAVMRAIWYQARTIAEGGWPGPFEPGTPQPTLARWLARLAGVSGDEVVGDRLRDAEAWLQERVLHGRGGSPAGA